MNTPLTKKNRLGLSIKERMPEYLESGMLCYIKDVLSAKQGLKKELENEDKLTKITEDLIDKWFDI